MGEIGEMGSKHVETQTVGGHESRNEKKGNIQQPQSNKAWSGHYGEIFARERFFIRLYTKPERNLEALNNLLKDVNHKQLSSNIWGAVSTGEIHHDLIPEIKAVLNCSQEWEYFPLTVEDIDPSLQAFLRWLLLTYGGSEIWIDFSERQITFVNRLLEAIKRGDIKTSMPRSLQNTEGELQYLQDLLNENLALDCFGERFQYDNTGQPEVVRNDTGFSNFTIANKPNIRISPTKLIMWVNHTLRQWRKAVRRDRPELAYLAPHRKYYSMDQTEPSAHQKQENHASHGHHVADEKLHEEIKAFSELIKRLRTPPTAAKYAPVAPMIKKSALKTPKILALARAPSVSTNSSTSFPLIDH